MDNLADELQAIADQPEGDPLEEFRAAGQRLVDALRDQFADGQAESLYSLQTASAQLRTHTEAITSAAATLVGSLKTGSAEITSHVTEALQGVLAETQASIGEQLAAEVDASSAELRGAAADHAQTVATQLKTTSTHLSELYESAAARAEHARQGLEWVAQQGAEQLTAAAATLTQHRTAAEEGLAAAAEDLTSRTAAGRQSLVESAESLAGQLQEAAARARTEITAAADSAAEALHATMETLLARTMGVRDVIDDALVEGRKAAEAELTALRKQVESAERREQAVTERLQQHVEELVARTDATVAQSLNHLRAVADALLERDAQLEKRRADEFARVLQVVLAEGGASTRRLRDRIFKGMESAKAAPPVPPAPAPEPSWAPAPEQPTEPRTTTGQAELPKKAPAKATTKKAPAQKAPAKKAPAKQPPAKKSAPHKGADTKAAEADRPRTDTADVPTETTPVQEEQA